MHYFWLWITFFVNSWTFMNKALLGKLRWQIFATIAERQIALPWRLRLYFTAYLPPSPREGWTIIRSRWVEHLSHNPKSVLEFRSRFSDLCEYNRCAGTYPTHTPMPVPVFKRDACGSYLHTYNIKHIIADKMTTLAGICADLESSNFFRIFI